ncbi:MAG: type II toxin-antitoxin system VapC family toxin [Saprospiraceae bacterium]
MGTRYLVDTNIAVYLLNGVLPTNAAAFLKPILDIENNLSVVSKIELLGWQFPNTGEEHNARIFVEESNIIGLTDEIAEKAIEIRKSTKAKLGDAIIAATALAQNLTLISRNEADFRRIPGLICINPFSL